MSGGSTLRIRSAVGEARAVIDNFSMKYVTAIDMTPINAAWIDLVDNTIKPKAALFESLFETEGRPMPIGKAAFRAGRIPEWNQTPPEPDDPELI
jgi:hypothetical protein